MKTAGGIGALLRLLGEERLDRNDQSFPRMGQSVYPPRRLPRGGVCYRVGGDGDPVRGGDQGGQG